MRGAKVCSARKTVLMTSAEDFPSAGNSFAFVEGCAWTTFFERGHVGQIRCAFSFSRLLFFLLVVDPPSHSGSPSDHHIIPLARKPQSPNPPQPTPQPVNNALHAQLPSAGHHCCRCCCSTRAHSLWWSDPVLCAGFQPLPRPTRTSSPGQPSRLGAFHGRACVRQRAAQHHLRSFALLDAQSAPASARRRSCRDRRLWVPRRGRLSHPRRARSARAHCRCSGELEQQLQSPYSCVRASL